MEAVITIRDNEDGGIGVSVEFSEPVDDSTRSAAASAAVWMVEAYASRNVVALVNVS